LLLNSVARGNGGASSESTDDDDEEPDWKQDSTVHDSEAPVLATLEAAAAQGDQDREDSEDDQTVEDELPRVLHVLERLGLSNFLDEIRVGEQEGEDDHQDSRNSRQDG